MQSFFDKSGNISWDSSTGPQNRSHKAYQLERKRRGYPPRKQSCGAVFESLDIFHSRQKIKMTAYAIQ